MVVVKKRRSEDRRINSRMICFYVFVVSAIPGQVADFESINGFYKLITMHG